MEYRVCVCDIYPEHGVHILNRFYRSVITYILLCGYSPFRAESAKELLEETKRSRIEFSDKYWANVSDEGMTIPQLSDVYLKRWITLAKQFILSLLRPEQADRPTAAQAADAHVCHLCSMLKPLGATQRSL